MSATAGVVKLLSAWNHGNPPRMEPLVAFMAWVTSPSDPATTSVPPCRSPTAIDAWTACPGDWSVEGLSVLVNHWTPPVGPKASYPPELGPLALPTPT